MTTRERGPRKTSPTSEDPILPLASRGCNVVAFIYMRVVVLMYMREPQEPAPARFPVAVSAVLALAALVTLIGGIAPGSFVVWAVPP